MNTRSALLSTSRTGGGGGGNGTSGGVGLGVTTLPPLTFSHRPPQPAPQPPQPLHNQAQIQAHAQAQGQQSHLHTRLDEHDRAYNRPIPKSAELFNPKNGPSGGSANSNVSVPGKRGPNINASGGSANGGGPGAGSQFVMPNPNSSLPPRPMWVSPSSNIAEFTDERERTVDGMSDLQELVGEMHLEPGQRSRDSEVMASTSTYGFVERQRPRSANE